MQMGPAKKARRTRGTGAASKAASRAPAKRKAVPRKKPEPLAPHVGSRHSRGKECSTLSAVALWQRNADRKMSAGIICFGCALINRIEAYMRRLGSAHLVCPVSRLEVRATRKDIWVKMIFARQALAASR